MGLFGSKSAERKADEAAKKADAYQQQGLGVLNGEYSKAQGASSLLFNQLGTMLNPILSQLYGNGYLATGDTNGGTNAMESDLLNQYIDYLKGNRTTEEQQRADEMTQNYINQLTGATKSPEQQQADEWSQKYLGMLQNSPDTAFSEGVSNLMRGLQNQRNQVANEMTRRGINGSGIALDKIAGTEADKSRGINQLQGDRLNRNMQNTALGADFTQSLANQQKQNYALATDMANNFASNKINNLGTAYNLISGRNANAISNIMNMLNGQGNASSMTQNPANALYSGYNNASGVQTNAAQNFANIAASNKAALGNLIGGVISGGFGLGAAKLMGGK